VGLVTEVSFGVPGGVQAGAPGVAGGVPSIAGGGVTMIVKGFVVMLPRASVETATLG
jgi:hypothetical protein